MYLNNLYFVYEMEFSLAKWSFVFTKWTHKIKIYELQLHFLSIQQLIRIKTKKGNATVLQKCVDSKVFRYKTEFSQAREMEFLCYEMHSQNQKLISQLKLTSTYIEKA